VHRARMRSSSLSPSVAGCGGLSVLGVKKKASVGGFCEHRRRLVSLVSTKIGSALGGVEEKEGCHGSLLPLYMNGGCFLCT
jgi:hypothetical protein